MPRVIGIDEAGYGRLGPLVVSSAAFEAPDASADLWRLLEAAVAPRAERTRTARLFVADSKAVYSGRKGLADLERGVLAFLAAGGARPPRSFQELLKAVCGEPGGLSGTAWWDDVALPAFADGKEIEDAAALLRAHQGSVRFLGFSARVVPAGEFNRLVARHKNKAVVLFQENMSLVERVMARHDGNLAFVIDKHGGRHYYERLLANNFFGHPIRVLSESPQASSYEVGLGDRTLRFAFIEKADVRHLPAALASMASKYVRELSMLCFNAYWCRQVDGLSPTAGYAGDSARFIAAIRPLFRDGDERDVIRDR